MELKKQFLRFVTLIFFISILTGCGQKTASSEEIQTLIANNISIYIDTGTNLGEYKLEDAEITSFEIIDRNVEKKDEDIQCVISFEDDFYRVDIPLQLHIAKQSRKSWQITSMTVDGNESYTVKNNPFEDSFMAIAVSCIRDYKGDDLTLNQSYIVDNTIYSTYSSSESFKYADIDYIYVVESTLNNDGVWEHKGYLDHKDVNWHLEGDWYIDDDRNVDRDDPVTLNLKITSFDNDSLSFEGSFDYYWKTRSWTSDEIYEGSAMLEDMHVENYPDYNTPYLYLTYDMGPEWNFGYKQDTTKTNSDLGTYIQFKPDSAYFRISNQIGLNVSKK